MKDEIIGLRRHRLGGIVGTRSPCRRPPKGEGAAMLRLEAERGFPICGRKRHGVVLVDDHPPAIEFTEACCGADPHVEWAACCGTAEARQTMCESNVATSRHLQIANFVSDRTIERG